MNLLTLTCVLKFFLASTWRVSGAKIRRVKLFPTIPSKQKLVLFETDHRREKYDDDGDDADDEACKKSPPRRPSFIASINQARATPRYYKQHILLAVWGMGIVLLFIQ